MLQEYKHVRQIDGEGPRRWFGDPDFDLIVWYSSDSPDRIVGFQLCYDKRGSEHAFTWREGGAVGHHRVDTGEGDPKANRSPILLADGPLPLARLTQSFADASQEIDAAVRAFVLERLGEVSPTRIP